MNIDCCKSYVGKQIIGLNGGASPFGPTCLYYTLPIYDLTYSSFTDPLWDWGGIGSDFSGYALSFGGYAVQDGIYGVGSYDQSNSLQFFYLGTTAPAPLTFNDPIFGPRTENFSPACSYGCLSTESFRYSNSPYIWITNIGSGMIAYCNLYNWGGALDFSLGAAYNENILAAMLSKYQPQATVSVVDDGGGFFRIVFNDFYYAMTGNQVGFAYNNVLNIEYVDEIVC